MPVEKYRSAEEMNAAPRRATPEAAFDRFVRHCARYRLISPPDYPRGVFKFKSLEAAQRARKRMSGGS